MKLKEAIEALENQNKRVSEVNIQGLVQQIHHQFGVSEKANYEIQKLFDSFNTHDVQQALETVLAAVKRADLTDRQINDMMPDDPSDVCESYYINGWINGARHVRDLLHGEGKE